MRVAAKFSQTIDQAAATTGLSKTWWKARGEGKYHVKGWTQEGFLGR
jgi:hypothetical protein